MKTRIRTVADLGVGPRETLADKIRNVAPTFKALTEKQKCFLSVPAGIIVTYIGIGFFRCLMVLLSGQSATPIMFIDWWWIKLLS